LYFHQFWGLCCCWHPLLFFLCSTGGPAFTILSAEDIPGVLALFFYCAAIGPAIVVVLTTIDVPGAFAVARITAFDATPNAVVLTFAAGVFKVSNVLAVAGLPAVVGFSAIADDPLLLIFLLLLVIPDLMLLMSPSVPVTSCVLCSLPSLLLLRSLLLPFLLLYFAGVPAIVGILTVNGVPTAPVPATLPLLVSDVPFLSCVAVSPAVTFVLFSADVSRALL
jgi:hypothetical protein